MHSRRTLTDTYGSEPAPACIHSMECDSFRGRQLATTRSRRDRSGRCAYRGKAACGSGTVARAGSHGSPMEKVRRYNQADGPPGAAVTALIEDQAGTMCVGNNALLFTLVGDRWQKAGTHHGLPDGSVYTAYVDKYRIRVAASTGSRAERGSARSDQPCPVDPRLRRIASHAGRCRRRLWVRSRDRPREERSLRAGQHEGAGGRCRWPP
jgi:hypothetical protein